MTDIKIPRLSNATREDIRQLDIFAKSVKSNVDSTVKAAMTGQVTAGQLAAISSQVGALSSKITTIQNQIQQILNELGGETFPVVGVYGLQDPPFSSTFVAVYEAAPNQVALADATVAGTAPAILGIATSFAPGGNVNVTVLGDVTNPSWAFTPGLPVFVGASGAIVQTLPVGAVYQGALGWAVTATRVFVVPSEPIFLSGTAVSLLGINSDGELVTTSSVSSDDWIARALAYYMSP